jgi:hypothetical protein
MSAATLLTVGTAGSSSPTAGESARAPLLDPSQHSSSASESYLDQQDEGGRPVVAAERAAVDWRFLRRFFGMLAPLRYPPYLPLFRGGLCAYLWG